MDNLEKPNFISVGDITKYYEKHLTNEKLIFAEHYAVIRDDVEALRHAGMTNEETTYEQAKLTAMALLNDKYVKGYINDLREFSLADGLNATYNEIIGYLTSVVNGTVRDVEGNLEFPKVSERTKAGTELLKILPESPQLKKLEADIEKQQVDTELTRAKSKILQSGGITEGENKVLEALRKFDI